MTTDQIAVDDPTLDEIFAEGWRTSPPAVAGRTSPSAGADRGTIGGLARECLAGLQGRSDEAAESETGFSGARNRLLTLKRMVCLADRAAADPAWWRVQKLHHYEPGLTAGEIAELLNMPHKKVLRLLTDVPIDEDDYASLPDYTTLRELERKKEERR